MKIEVNDIVTIDGEANDLWIVESLWYRSAWADNDNVFKLRSLVDLTRSCAINVTYLKLVYRVSK